MFVCSATITPAIGYELAQKKKTTNKRLQRKIHNIKIENTKFRLQNERREKNIEFFFFSCVRNEVHARKCWCESASHSFDTELFESKRHARLPEPLHDNQFERGGQEAERMKQKKITNTHTRMAARLTGSTDEAAFKERTSICAALVAKTIFFRCCCEIEWVQRCSSVFVDVKFKIWIFAENE